MDGEPRPVSPDAEEARCTPRTVQRASLGRRLVWVPVGLACVALGGLGLVLPGLPATIFFIGAAAAFSRSSPRLERWVLGLKGIGPLVRDHRAGLGMPRRAKIVAIAMMSAAVTVSALALDHVAARVVLALLWAIGTVVIVRVRPRGAVPSSTPTTTYV